MTNVTGPTAKLAASESAAVQATFTGGSAIVYNGHASSAAALVSNNQVKLGNSGNSYIKITLASESLKEGDIISIESNQTGDNNTFKPAQTGDSFVKFPYTIPQGSSLVGAKELYLRRNNPANTITSITITRHTIKFSSSPSSSLSTGTKYYIDTDGFATNCSPDELIKLGFNISEELGDFKIEREGYNFMTTEADCKQYLWLDENGNINHKLSGDPDIVVEKAVNLYKEQLKKINRKEAGHEERISKPINKLNSYIDNCFNWWYRLANQDPGCYDSS